MQHRPRLHAWPALGLAWKSWHEERTNGTKGANRTTPAHAPSTWIQLTVERRWSEGGFQPSGVCVCVCVFVLVHLNIKSVFFLNHTEIWSDFGTRCQALVFVHGSLRNYLLLWRFFLGMRVNVRVVSYYFQKIFGFVENNIVPALELGRQCNTGSFNLALWSRVLVFHKQIFIAD